MTGRVEKLEWDSVFFGFPVGKVHDEITTTGELKLAVREADRCKLHCTYLLVAAHDHSLLDSAQGLGFVVRDIRVELERPVAGHPSTAAGLQRGGPTDLPQLGKIARERFTGTRFFADQGFPADRSAELYVEWLSRGLRGERGWVTLVADDFSGFVVCHLDDISKVGAITLIGVAEDATGRGIGSVLLAGAGALFADAALLTATVVTQGHNVAAQRLYQSHGYKTAATHLWLHRWLS